MTENGMRNATAAGIDAVLGLSFDSKVAQRYIALNFSNLGGIKAG